MNCTLTRGIRNENGIFGTLDQDGGDQICVTLEHAYLVAGKWMAKLAAGVYTCELYQSPEHGYKLYVVKDVPDFMGQPVTFIELHIGCFNCDSKGCCLLGEELRGIMITNSRVTFSRFMNLQAGCKSFQLTVLDAA